MKKSANTKKAAKKASQYQVLLVSIFAVIILLAFLAFMVQRNTYLGAAAGKAIQQRIQETKQLAFSAEEAKIALAKQQGSKQVDIDCPLELFPAAESHWKVDGGWKISSLKVQEASCGSGMESSRMYCFYAEAANTVSNAASMIGTYLDLPGLDCKSCEDASCKFEIK